MDMKLSIFIMICVSCLVLSGCKSTPVGKKQVTMPAKEKGLINSKRIAVINVVDSTKSRNYTSNIQSKFESFLTGIKVGNNYRFTVVDRSAIETVMKEQRFASEDTFDGSTAVELGNLLGADTLMNATFSVPPVSSSKFTEKESYCSRREGDKCKDWAQRNITCDRKTATVEFTPKATSVTNGQIVYSKSYTYTTTSSRCPNEVNVSLKSDDEMIGSALSSVFNTMRRDIADYPLVLNLQLIDDDDGMSDSDSEEFNMAMEFANQDMWDRACSKLNVLAGSVQRSPAMMYDLGVCAEMEGQPDAAKGYYEQALNYMSSLSSSDKDLVFKAIKRMEGKLNLDDHNKESKSIFDKMKDSVTDLM